MRDFHAWATRLRHFGLMMSTRSAIESDYSEIGRIFHAAVRVTAALNYSEEQVRAWSPEELPAEHWRKRTAELEVRVAVVDQVVAGFIGFSWTGYVDLLFTRPGFTRRGVGRMLVNDAEEEMRSLRVETAWTQASLTAQPFFRTMGYQLVREQVALCAGVELRTARMEKGLR